MNIYTPQQAADLLQVSRQTLLRLCRTGELKCSKIGRQWRISDEQISRFMTENETTMTAVTDDTSDGLNALLLAGMQDDEEQQPVKRRYTKQPPDTRPPEERLKVPDVL